MKLNINHSRRIKIFGTVLGTLIVCGFATIQHIVVFREIQLTSYIIPAIVGGLAGFIISTWFSKLSEAKKEIEENHDRLKLVLEGTETGLWDWYPKTHKVIFDKQWCNLIGYELNEIKPTFESWNSRAHPDDIEQTYADIQNHIEGKTAFYNNIHRMKHKDGHWVYLLARGQIVERDSNNQPVRFTGTHTDITHLKEMENALENSNKQLKQLSLIDGLTNLHNRRALDKHLIQEWNHWERNNTPICILMIDIDFFKQFNDLYGHLAGDDCLKQVAKILKSNVKRTNDMAARYGGEEFLIILSGLNRTEAVTVAQNLHSRIEYLAIPHKGSLVGSKLTVSIGINGCDSEHQCHSYNDLINGADQALYEAKQLGRNRTVLCKADKLDQTLDKAVEARASTTLN
ncbi:MAG: sensor domain-containing diguanylate cyclase [Pseudomonadota bacterium]|nr:sensor domain-containing diguanylate cyclase [Pseudomonadota bacterium]